MTRFSSRFSALVLAVACVAMGTSAFADVVIQNTTDPILGFIGRGDVLTALQLQGTNTQGPVTLPDPLYVKVTTKGYYVQDFIKVLNNNGNGNSNGNQGNGTNQHSFVQGYVGATASLTCVTRYNSSGNTGNNGNGNGKGKGNSGNNGQSGSVITGYEFSAGTDVLIPDPSTVVIHHPNANSGWTPVGPPTLQGASNNGGFLYTIEISTNGTTWIPLAPPSTITFGTVPTNFP